MAQVTCPGCKRTLWITDGPGAGAQTCPNCLAKIERPKPETEVATLLAMEQGRDSSPTNARCPRCNTPMESDWKVCAYCRLVGWDDKRASSSLDVDVWRDQKGTSIVLILLAVLGGLTVCLSVWTALWTAAYDRGDAWFVAGVLGVVFVLALVVTGIVLYRARHATIERGVGGIAFATLSVLGGLFVVPCALGTPLLFLFGAEGQKGKQLAIVSTILIGASVVLILAIPLGRFRPHPLIVLLFTLPAVIAVLILFGTTCAQLQKL